MNPLHLVPLAEPVPAGWGWFKLFLILGFAVHILLVNIVIGVSVISLFASFGRKRLWRRCARDTGSRRTDGCFCAGCQLRRAAFSFLQVLYGLSLSI
ncbi:MAG: hypothetical protein R2941_07095 [Desulfobacterales bacterium]